MKTELDPNHWSNWTEPAPQRGREWFAAGADAPDREAYVQMVKQKLKEKRSEGRGPSTDHRSD